jgi:iron complex outermembrane receptor protein
LSEPPPPNPEDIISSPTSQASSPKSACLWIGLAFPAAMLFSPQPALSQTAPSADGISVNDNRGSVAAPATATQSFIAIDPAMAEDQYILNIAQTSRDSPGLLAKTNTGVPLAARFFLRQPVPDSTNYFTKTNANTYVDGVYYNRPYGALYDFIDIEQIDVLPTAQGTLFGRSSSDGAILITTKQPGQHFAATGDVTVGTKSWLDFRAAISGPITDVLSASFSALARNRDGLTSATELGATVNSRDYQAGRAKIFYTPSDVFDVTLSGDLLRDRSSPKYPSALSTFAPGQDPLATPNRDIFTTEAVTPDLNRLDQQGISIVANYRFEDFAIKSITGYRDIEATSYVTYDATPANVLSTESIVHQNQLTEDLSVSGGNDWLKGTAGLYYMRKDTKQRTPTGASPNFSREFDYSYAAYGQLTATVTQSIDLIAGLHYAIEDKDFSSDFYAGNGKATLNGVPTPIPASALNPQSVSKTWYGLTPRAGINFQITPDLLAYFSYTRGYKSGGWNNRLPPNYDAAGNIVREPLQFLPEAVDQYQIGAKASFLDHRLSLNLSAYIHDYTNLQIPVLRYNSSTYYLTSAPGAQITGLEIDPAWQIRKDLQFYGLIALQHGNYSGGPFPCQGVTGNTVDCSAEKLIGLAPLRVLAGLVYSPDLPIDGKLRLGVSVNYSDKYENSILGVDLAATNSRTLLDASISYDTPDKHWTFTLEGRNITNVHWFSSAAQNGTAVVVYPDDPATVTVRARYRY